MAPRTFLFAPGHNPRLVEKATASSADHSVLDLEDGVPPDMKGLARTVACGRASIDPRVVVRINAVNTPFIDDDIEACRTSRVRLIMLPKADPEAVDWVTSRLPAVQILALVETAIGVVKAPETAQRPAVIRLALGAEDLAAQMQLGRIDENNLNHVMAALVLASAAGGLPGPIAPVTIRLDDPTAVRADAAFARSRGFRGKLLVHPDHIDPAVDGLRPTIDETAWAREVCANASDTGDLIRVGSYMVDAPVLSRARRILAEADS